MVNVQFWRHHLSLVNTQNAAKLFFTPRRAYYAAKPFSSVTEQDGKTMVNEGGDGMHRYSFQQELNSVHCGDIQFC